MNDIGFVPPEGVVLPKAVISLAMIRHSEFWLKHLISRPEGEVWVEAMTTGNPRWLTDRAKRAYFDEHNEEGEPFTYGDDFKGRVASYHSAENEIRASLALGILVAAFFDGAGIVHQIPKELWVADTGVSILNTGLAGVKDDSTSGTVFVIERTFRRVFFDEVDEPTGEPPKAGKPGIAGAIYRTGAQGRPSAMHFIIPEAQRRAEADEVPDSRGLFNDQLMQWLKDHHPEAPKTTGKAIGNNPDVTEIYRQVRARRAKAASKY